MSYDAAPSNGGDYGSSLHPPPPPSTSLSPANGSSALPGRAPTQSGREFPIPPSRRDRGRSVSSRSDSPPPRERERYGGGGGGRDRSRSRSRGYGGGGGGGRERERSPYRGGGGGGGGGDWERRGPPPPRPRQQPPVPTASNTLGVFGLSIRTREPDLDMEFARYGTVESVTIVYDQRTDRSRGFGFIRMGSVDQATACIEKLNNYELHGRRLRVDYSTTQRAHDPTPGAYMGIKRDDDGPPPRSSGGYGRDRAYGTGRYDDYRGGGRDRDYDRRRDDHYYDPTYRRSSPPRRRDDYDYGRSDRGRYRSPSPTRDRDPRASRTSAYGDGPAPPATGSGADLPY